MASSALHTLLLERRARLQVQWQLEVRAFAGEIRAELRDGFAQHRVVGILAPALAVGGVPLSLEPDAGQSAVGGGEQHGAQGLS